MEKWVSWHECSVSCSKPLGTGKFSFQDSTKTVPYCVTETSCTKPANDSACFSKFKLGCSPKVCSRDSNPSGKHQRLRPFSQHQSWCQVGNQMRSKNALCTKIAQQMAPGHTERGPYTALISLKLISKILLKNLVAQLRAGWVFELRNIKTLLH